MIVTGQNGRKLETSETSSASPFSLSHPTAISQHTLQRTKQLLLPYLDSPKIPVYQNGMLLILNQRNPCYFLALISPLTVAESTRYLGSPMHSHNNHTHLSRAEMHKLEAAKWRGKTCHHLCLLHKPKASDI